MLRVETMAVRSVARASRVRFSSAPVTSAERSTYFGPLTIDNGVAIIRLDGPEKMNTLNDKVLAESQKLWAEKIENDPTIKAAVFISSKPDNFIAGADIQVRSFCT
jgi:hypothetical protein